LTSELNGVVCGGLYCTQVDEGARAEGATIDICLLALTAALLLIKAMYTPDTLKAILDQ